MTNQIQANRKAMNKSQRYGSHFIINKSCKARVVLGLLTGFILANVHAEENATASSKFERRFNLDEGFKFELNNSDNPISSTSQLDSQQIFKQIKDDLDSQQPSSNAENKAPIQLSIADSRALALKNNLALKIEQFEPIIAQTKLNEERAKFDNIMFANIKDGNQNLPSKSGDLIKLKSNNINLNDELVRATVQEQQFNSLVGDVGLSIPLRTGGNIKISSPFENKVTKNPFGSDQYRSALRFSISQPLLRDGGVRNNEASIEIANYEQQGSQAKARLQSIRVLSVIDKAYWDLHQAWVMLEIGRQQYDYASQNLAMVKRRVKEGLSAAIEVSRAEIGVADRLERLVIAKTEWQISQRQLKFYLNDDRYPLNSVDFFSITTLPSVEPYTFHPDELVEQALRNRLDLLDVELKLAADAINVSYLENQTLPLFTLDYAYGALSDSANTFSRAYGNIRESTYNDWYVGLRFEMPVTNEARRARLHRAVEQRQQRLSTKTLKELTIRKEIHDALDVLNQNWKRVLLARQQVVIAGINYDAEMKQFKAGLRTMTEVIETLTRLGESQTKEIRAITDYQIAQIDLAYATGTLLGYSQVSFSNP